MSKRLDMEVKQGSRTKIMGILNVTPDSFSDGGKFNQVDAAIDRVADMIEAGADLIDIGGESTRPGYTPVSVEEEIERTSPVIEQLVERFEVPISIDTFKAKTAEAALKAGASIINDVWGAKADPQMARIAVEYEVPIILMHNRDQTPYGVFMNDVLADLSQSISICTNAGVKAEHIWLDPGVGFAKTYEQNLEVMRELNQIVDLGFPVLLGTSRKSFIAKTLQLPVDERVEGTGATVCLGITKGVSVVRVHDVKEMKRMALMMDAMLQRSDEVG
ncbi:dihydropteroate synthase [Bacillus sp. JCM 19047]|uniref:Dihydropteroate synthase n=1 Tax=Shouchella miscanthi TaxID=2598861 RepID=A0ABU6NFK5_9BACI|nr:dihydropteroate synthase [Shouchella miscanthi]MED4126817.1 dihydropteroate synthase [Shouchella miscanthi]GAF22162.1 dihydropteroate synthase [Bacillus sp. JCM 19047]